MAALTHVLFDFFGTLVAYSESRSAQRLDRSYGLLVAAGARLSYDEFTRAWDAAFDEHDRRALRSYDEFSMDELIAAFLPAVLPRAPDDALSTSFRDAFLDEWSQGVHYIPQVAELLEQLAQRFTLVLVTNTHHAELVHGHLRKMGVDRHFHSVITSVEHGRRKPSPCIFHRALEQAGGRVEAAVYVGDSYTADYQGALQAGLRPLLIDPEQRHAVPAEHRLASVLDARMLLDH
ncbi:MAG TPA: HAD family hydrolase [Polyangiales bacterium]|nr:HAD family hydrolase [Polyangiales bacterium]